ncbi:hypothetical protein N7535_009297 [Penicillium sp. DV-2018c]|nr:hypothetical protein N7535_009297 [Penicillium sp. DV-2018c]
MSSDNPSPQAGESYNNNASQETPRTGLQGHNPAIARYSKLRLRPNTIVKPDLFTLYFGFFGTNSWQRQVASRITERVENHYVLTGRPPTQDELDAYVEHGTRTMYHSRTGGPLGGLLCGAMLYRQARKSPLYPQKPTPNSLLAALNTATVASKTGSIIGAAVFKMIFFVTAGGLFSSLYASAYTALSMIGDPRLKQSLTEMQGQDRDEVDKRRNQAASERRRYMRQGEPDIGSQMRKGIGRSDGDGLAGDSGFGYEQEAEVQPVNSYSEYERSNAGAGEKYGVDDSQTGNQSRGAGWARGGQPQSQPEGKSSLDLLDEDDASPTAAEYRDTNIDGSPSGSAWDRLRQQNSNGRFQPRHPGRPAPIDSPYGGYGIPKRKDDQNSSGGGSERSSAQAEFDRLIDSERNAGNGGSQSRGWGS